MNIEKTNLPGVLIVNTNKYKDNRGFFLETYHQERYLDHNIPGINLKFVQDNHSFSYKNVLRGMHFQLEKPQGKLVSVINGNIFDVVADVNPKSKYFKKWIGVNLTSDNGKQLWIPPGYAHGFCVISDTANFVYKCTEFFDPNLDIGLNWNDPEINIDWPIKEPILSEKDRSLPFLNEVTKKYF
tara:strand:+ start:1392 stop:1943 length:552 start_codon:yes stop_codon:yes gene_type:complete